jgi:hypothetical protein
MSENLIRYKIYRSRRSRNFLCICAARNRHHALKIARQNFWLDRSAFAIPTEITRTAI